MPDNEAPGGSDDTEPKDAVTQEVTEEQPFTGNILIQLFDESGQLKDERRAGGAPA